MYVFYLYVKLKGYESLGCWTTTPSRDIPAVIPSVEQIDDEEDLDGVYWERYSNNESLLQLFCLFITLFVLVMIKMKLYLRKFCRDQAVLKCAWFAKDHGYKVFAVRSSGECLTSANASRVYKYYGESNDCQDGEGGHGAMDVYRLKGK